MKVIWTKQAIGNLEDIQDYIALDSPKAAYKTTERIRHLAHALLPENPHLGRTGRIPGTSELIIPDLPYIIPYRVQDSRIEILTVYHNARQWPPGF